MPFLSFLRAIAMLCFILTVTPGAQAQGSDAATVARQRLHVMGVIPGAEALVQFAAQGDVNVVNLLMQAGLDVNRSDPVRKVTALHNAAAQGHLRLVQSLLQQGATVDLRDWHGNTALINAAYFGKFDTVKLLVQHKADLNAVSAQGLSVVGAAVYAGKADLVNWLLHEGARLDLTGDDFFQAPLTIAQRSKNDALIAILERAKKAAITPSPN